MCKRTCSYKPIQSVLHRIALSSLCLLASTVLAGNDPHYNDAGFFDIHVCNWPDRPLFLMPLFSTERFSEISRIEVLDPNNNFVMDLDLQQFRTIDRKRKPEKRVFIQQMDLPENAVDGWYSANITLKDGNQYVARDYVIHSLLPQVGGQVPGDEVELESVPGELAWEAVSGASYFQVFIRDLWNEGKLIYSSELLKEPRLTIPDGLLESGGYYSWIIHARDINEHILLGDFNHGSLNRPATFSIQ